MRKWLIQCCEMLDEQSLKNPKQFIVEADYFVIEPCGAITFWENVVPGQKSDLVIAYRTWTTLSLLVLDDKG